MSKVAERLHENSKRVRENEKRVAAQLVFVERLQASGKNTRSAEEALEVMRSLLCDLYRARVLLRRQAAGADARNGAMLRISTAAKRRPTTRAS